MAKDPSEKMIGEIATASTRLGAVLEELEKRFGDKVVWSALCSCISSAVMNDIRDSDQDIAAETRAAWVERAKALVSLLEGADFEALERRIAEVERAHSDKKLH